MSRLSRASDFGCEFGWPRIRGVRRWVPWRCRGPTALRHSAPPATSKISHIPRTHSQASWTLETYISQTCTSQMCTHGGVYLVDMHLTYTGVHVVQKRVPYGHTSHGRASHGCASHGCAPHGRVSHGRASFGHTCHGDTLHRHAHHRRASHRRVSWACISRACIL